MGAIAEREDPLARAALTLLRRTGLRLGECLDLELCCVVDYGPTGIWLRVSLGKFGTERSVRCRHRCRDRRRASQRGTQRPHPHPRTNAPTDFLLVEGSRRPKAWRIRKGLRAAATHPGLLGPDGDTLNVTPHQLRHTYATELANAGMSLQALMAVLGHVTPK
jgi:integrase